MPPKSATVRPVTKKLPKSNEIWEDTNLPLCLVALPGILATSPVSATLTSIPKCLNCGAPHPTLQTHLRPSSPDAGMMVCYLCGTSCSTDFDDQEEAREEELMDEAIYDKVPSKPFDQGGDQFYQVPLIPASDLENDDDDESEPSDIMSLPAKACPPVWWIVLDASQSSRSYWTTVGDVLEASLQDIPEHVHIGLVAASSSTLSTWEVTSSVPHVQHYSLTSPKVPLSLAPCDPGFRTNLITALRAMADAPSLLTTTDEDGLGMALGLTLEVLLEFMEQAQHPGDFASEEDDEDEKKGNPQASDDQAAAAPTLRYAGGKILCLLANPPLEVEAKDDVASQPAFYAGGVGGSCAGHHLNSYWESPEDLPDVEISDMTPANLAKTVMPLQPEDVLETVGKRCAAAALGVDVLVVVPDDTGMDEDENKDGDDDDDAAKVALRPVFGLPLLKILADTSGTPGPLLFGTQSTASVQALKDQVLARAPWALRTIFGATLRVRTSPGLSLEDSPIDPVGKAKMQLAPLLSSGGLSGPVLHLDDGLWIMGACDAHTSVIMDFQVDKGGMETVVKADGFGEVGIKPAAQFCVVYTSVETNEQGEYHTVRKIKISSVSLPVVEDVEPLFDALDLEALAVVLFQKLLINALQDGLESSYETAGLWLRALLVCVYQSAQVEQARLEELMEDEGVETVEELENAKDIYFVGKERLLDVDGELDDEDVLLGQAHAKVAVLPLILYSLVQCDALRPSGGSYLPSMDARCAAMAQMATMTPTILSKCIAPVLQLWSKSQDKRLCASIDLNDEAVEKALKDFKMEKDGLFFLDSPQHTLVCAANEEVSSDLKVGPKLQASVHGASKAYRTKPPLFVETKEKGTRQIFENSMIEDFNTAAGTEGFEGWKTEIAEAVLTELKKSGDIESDSK